MSLRAPYLLYTPHTGTPHTGTPQMAIPGVQESLTPALSLSTGSRLAVGMVQLILLSVFLYLWIAIRLDNRTAARMMWYVMALAVAALTSLLVANAGECHAILAVLFVVPVLNVILFETYLCDQDKAPRKLKALRIIAISINSAAVLLVLWGIVQYGFVR